MGFLESQLVTRCGPQEPSLVTIASIDTQRSAATTTPLCVYYMYVSLAIK